MGPILIPLGEVVLFAQPGCEHADGVRRLLAGRGLAWREHDTSDPGRLSREAHLVYTSYLRTPILCAAGYAMVGFDDTRINEVIDEHLARLTRLGAWPA